MGLFTERVPGVGVGHMRASILIEMCGEGHERVYHERVEPQCVHVGRWQDEWQDEDGGRADD